MITVVEVRDCNFLTDALILWPWFCGYGSWWRWSCTLWNFLMQWSFFFFLWRCFCITVGKKRNEHKFHSIVAPNHPWIECFMAAITMVNGSFCFDWNFRTRYENSRFRTAGTKTGIFVPGALFFGWREGANKKWFSMPRDEKKGSKKRRETSGLEKVWVSCTTCSGAERERISNNREYVTVSKKNGFKITK